MTAASKPTPAASPRRSDFLFESLVRVAGFSAIAFVLLIFLFLLREGVPAFFEVPLGNLFGTRWYPTFDLYGALPLILGSLLVTVTAIVIALPLGVATAVFVREVAPNWAREILKPLIEVLAGIPSVVLGFFGMTVLAPGIRTGLGMPTGLTAFTGAVLLAYMALPTIISVAEDALDAVPKSYRDASLAMGATHWQTIWRVLLPAARSGIVASIILGMGRAIGETMAMIMILGNAAQMPHSILNSARTLTTNIGIEMGYATGDHRQALFATGVVLFFIIMGLNSLALIFSRKGRA